MGCKGGVLPLVKEKESCSCIKPYEQFIDIEQRAITSHDPMWGPSEPCVSFHPVLEPPLCQIRAER